LNTALDWEIDLILWLRELLPGLVPLFEAMTFLGNELFFMMVLPLIFWCLDRRTGARVTILLLLSVVTNTIAKGLFDRPRPLDYDPDRVLPLFKLPLDEATERYESVGGGFPSGHTQNSVTLWGYLIAQLSDRRAEEAASAEGGTAALHRLKPALLALFALLIVLVPLSRIYLAVHFPRDILGGYILGVALLLAYLALSPAAEGLLAELSLAWQLALAAGIPIILMLAFPYESVISGGATMLGMGVGFALERRWVRFETEGAIWRRALRFPLGMVLLIALYGGLKAVFTGLEPALLFRAVRYGLIGIWGGLGAPWVFVRLNLAGREPS
jgi:membrane-associated phospholipid phosphatase